MITLVILIAALLGCNSSEVQYKKVIKAIEVFSFDVEANTAFSGDYGKFSYIEYQADSAFDIGYHEFLSSNPDSIKEITSQVYSSTELIELLIRLSKHSLFIASIKDFSFEYDEPPIELQVPIDTSKFVEHYKKYQSFEFAILKNRSSAECQMFIYDNADSTYGVTNLPNYAPYWADFIVFDLFGDKVPEIITITPNYIGGRDIYSIDMFRIESYVAAKKPF